MLENQTFLDQDKNPVKVKKNRKANSFYIEYIGGYNDGAVYPIRYEYAEMDGLKYIINNVTLTFHNFNSKTL